MRIISSRLVLAIVAIVTAQPAFSKTAFEDRPIELTYQKQIHLNVANEAVNRINFANFRIVRLIGNISSFDSILSEAGSDLFIAPKLPEGKKIDFSALLSSGDIIDFSLNVVKGTSPYLVKLKFPSKSREVVKSEASSMIEAMRKGVIGKYYAQKSNKKINISSKPELKAVIENYYRYDNLRGISLILQNTNRSRSIEVTPELLTGSFAGVVAIYIEKELLLPAVKTRAYIVFKEVAA